MISNEKILEIKSRLIKGHEDVYPLFYPQSLTAVAHVDVVVDIIRSDDKQSSWKTLLEIFVLILDQYHDGKKWKFNILRIFKHIKVIKKIIQLFKNI